MVPSDPPCDVSELFVEERRRLLDVLAGVDEAGWQEPSPCPAWSVLGLCAHLVGDDFSLLARHRDGHHGTRPPAGLTEEEFIRWLDGVQMEWVAAARRLSPRLVADLLAWAGPQVADVFAGADPQERSALVSWAGPHPVPLWLDHLREVSEYWIHRQQLLQALGRPSDLRPDVAAPILDALRWAYPYRLATVEAAAGDSVSIEIAGEVTATWLLVAGDGGWDFRPEADGPVVARVSMTTEAAWRLLTNNLSAPDRERLRVSGDPAVTHLLLRTRAVIGAPK